MAQLGGARYDISERSVIMYGPRVIIAPAFYMEGTSAASPSLFPCVSFLKLNGVTPCYRRYLPLGEALLLPLIYGWISLLPPRYGIQN